MRVLLDECVPRRLRDHISDHSVRTVADMGWSGVRNGELLKRACSEFDCFTTTDRNLQFQQHLPALPIGVVVMRAMNNRLQTLLPLVPELRAALARIKPGELIEIGKC